MARDRTGVAVELTSSSLLLQAPVSVWDEEEDGATFTVTSRQYRPPDPLVRS